MYIDFNNNIQTIGASSFYLCNKIRKVTIPSSVITIEGYSFSCMKNLEDVLLGENVQKIGKNVFSSCENLKNLIIPKSVKNISINPFQNCQRIENIFVSKENEFYSNYKDDGVLYDKNITMLISYPCGNTLKDYVVPNTIEVIESEAFYSCYNLESIRINDNIKTIKYLAFYQDFNLHCIYYNGNNINVINKLSFVFVTADVISENEIVKSIDKKDENFHCKIDVVVINLKNGMEFLIGVSLIPVIIFIPYLASLCRKRTDDFKLIIDTDETNEPFEYS